MIHALLLAAQLTTASFIIVTPQQGFEPLRVRVEIHVEDGYTGPVCVEVKAEPFDADSAIDISCWTHSARSVPVTERTYRLEYGMYEINLGDKHIVQKVRVNVIEHDQCAEARKNRKPCF